MRNDDDGTNPMMMPSGESARLTPRDEAALDALVEAGFDPTRVVPEMRADSERVARLLGMLDTEIGSGARGASMDASDDDERARMADRVVGAVRMARQSSESLSRQDGEALEAFVMSGYRAGRTPSGLRETALVHETVHGMITTLGPGNERWIADGRTDRIENAVARALAATSPIPFERPVRRRSFRFADVFAAAAALLLVSAFTMPVMNSVAEDGHRRVCTSNLQAAGLGMGLYALDNHDALPMATAGFGGNWAHVGEPGESQSANLFTLVRTRHVQPWELDCPGNEFAPRGRVDRDAGDWSRPEEVSYSYRLMPRGRARIDVLTGESIVLADRSPMLLAALAGHRISPEASSPNHGSEGQHLLRVDGGVSWASSPLLANGDNIWLPRQVEQAVQDYRKKYGFFEGTELPATTDDTFLGP